MKEKEILAKVELLNEEDKYNEIAEYIEGLPKEERTPKIISELAKAYNNMANVIRNDDSAEARILYKKAVELLNTVERDLCEDHCFNYRKAYALYGLNKEHKALGYFERALEQREGDEDTIYFINLCKDILAYPNFRKCFSSRVKEGWENFIKGEGELRKMLASKEDSEAIMSKCDELLSDVFESIYLEIGYNNGRGDLVFNLEGDWSLLYAYEYFKKMAPNEVSEHWDIHIGRQPAYYRIKPPEDSNNYCIEMMGKMVTADDIMFWTDWKNSEVNISVYCTQLKELMKEDRNGAYWLLNIILDHAVGELAEMKYVSNTDILDMPMEDKSLRIDELMEDFADNLELTIDELLNSERYINMYTCYEGKPDENADDGMRRDIYVGTTNCVPVISDFLNSDTYMMDNFHNNGIAAGYIYYPLKAFNGENRGEKILDFRDRIADAIEKKAGEGVFRYIGGATGIYFGYLDLIAYDINAVLEAAAEVLASEEVEWAVWHVFRNGIKGVILKDNKPKIKMNNTKNNKILR